MAKQKYHGQTHSTDSLFVAVAFLIYAGCMAALICMGAMVYQSITQNMNTNNSSRTAVSYLTEKVRQNDTAGAISVTELEQETGGSEALVSALEIKKTYKDTEYVTYIYALDGSLRELFTRLDNPVSLDAGTEILGVEELFFEEEENGLIRVSIKDAKKQERSFWLHTNSAAEKTEETS